MKIKRFDEKHKLFRLYSWKRQQQRYASMKLALGGRYYRRFII